MKDGFVFINTFHKIPIFLYTDTFEAKFSKRALLASFSVPYAYNWCKLRLLNEYWLY
jgi:hypothetical protein